MTRIQVSNQGPMSSLFLSFDGHMKKTSGLLVDLNGAVCTRIKSGKQSYAADLSLIGQWLWLEYNNSW